MVEDNKGRVKTTRVELRQPQVSAAGNKWRRDKRCRGGCWSTAEIEIRELDKDTNGDGPASEGADSKKSYQGLYDIGITNKQVFL